MVSGALGSGRIGRKKGSGKGAEETKGGQEKLKGGAKEGGRSARGSRIEGGREGWEESEGGEEKDGGKVRLRRGVLGRETAPVPAMRMAEVTRWCEQRQASCIYENAALLTNECQ